MSSGAIAAGMQRLGWAKRPTEMSKLQAAAAVGQMGLVEAYEKAFSRHGLHTAQILLTHEDLADRSRYLNARSTLTTLLALGVVPIINENDTVVTDEIKFGDNDTLGALVANLIEAEALIILTDQQGLYTADPRKDPAATLIGEGRAEDRQYEAMAGGSGSAISKGGMITKIRAAQRAARSGAHTCIASGREPDPILRLAAGEALGTLLYASSTPLQARKQWLADHLQLAGDLVIDDGAVAALKSGKSLLPPAAGGRGRGAWGFRARRGGGLPQPGRRGSRARAGELLRFGMPAHRAQADRGDREPDRLPRRAGTGASGWCCTRPIPPRRTPRTTAGLPRTQGRCSIMSRRFQPLQESLPCRLRP